MSQKKHKSLGDKMAYMYIRRIKKWMYCPACKNGKMVINKASTMWICEDCGYSLSADEFEDDYVFWFCDECETFLNTQEGFDRYALKHICTKCGYENDTTANNLRGICIDCGKIIPDPEQTICADCRIARRQRAKERLKTVGMAAGITAVTVGSAILASHSSDKELSTDTLLPPEDSDDDEHPICDMCGVKMTGFDGVAWYTCPSCGNRVRKDESGKLTWEREIFGPHITSKKCAQCGQSLSGGSYTMPWEDGSNSDGYVKCPHCGYVNFEWDDD